MNRKAPGIIVSIACLALLAFALYRDSLCPRGLSEDLRNRIVGARIIRDGQSPYFYKWRPADGIRYYDHQNFDSNKVSNITATPFFHQLITPMAEMPQWKIAWWWSGI